MCGRFIQSCSSEEAAELFDLEEIPEDLPPRYNIAPTQLAAVVRNEDVRRLRMLRWGLIPNGAPDPSIGNRLINARAETAGVRPSFRDAFRARRCLIPVDGFFEWERLGRRRQPWLFRMREGGPFALAGLFERWRPPPGFPDAAGSEHLETFTILTTEANRVVGRIHDRMPVIVSPAAFGDWLGGAGSAARSLSAGGDDRLPGQSPREQSGERRPALRGAAGRRQGSGTGRRLSAQSVRLTARWTEAGV